MKEEFLLMAENEVGVVKNRSIIPDWLKAAAVILFVLGTFAAGYFSGINKNNNTLVVEMEQLKQQVLLAGLQEYSGPQKIQAVYSVANTNHSNTDVIEALINTLNSDKNINVRLAALSVLSDKVAENEKVKAALIGSLKIQENPLVQISLIQALTQSGVKEARENINYLTKQKDTDQHVKDFAQSMLKTMI